MNKDAHLMFESYMSKYADPKPITNYAIKQLELMHDKLHGLSTAIELARQPEIDQMLSKIRDLADMLISDSKHAESEESGVSGQEGQDAQKPNNIEPILQNQGAGIVSAEDAEDASKSPFHYDPMHGLASAAHKIRDELQGAANDEARPEHLEKMAEIILGPQSAYASVDHYKKAWSGVMELLNHYVAVSMN